MNIKTTFKSQNNSLCAFIWCFIKPYRMKFLCIICIAFVWGVEMSARPYTIKLLLDHLEGSSTDERQLFMTLLLPIAGYLGCEALINIVFRFYDYIRMFIYPSLQADIIREMTSYAQGHSHEFFINRLSGSLAAQIKELAIGIKEILQIGINRFFSHIFAIILACGTVFTVNPSLALIILAWIIFFILITFFLSKKSAIISTETSKVRNQTVGKITDSILNIMTVRLFARKGHEISRIEEQLSEQVIWDKRLEWTNLKIRFVQGTSILLMMSLLLIALVHARSRELVSIGDFGLILTIGVSISTAIQNISLDFVTFFELLGKCKVSLQLIEVPHEITDMPSAEQLVITNGEIVFEHVTFAYKHSPSLFQNLSIKIGGGEKVGLIGFSGAGKSTFIHLIMRLFEPQDGFISIDGQRIHEVTQESLRSQISLIPQDPSLFHRSIRENILYGSPQASEEELLEASRQACALEFIQSFPQRFDTIVGERGLRLSGGQKQRIVIARAFLKKAPILLLDEATASLDSLSELELQKSLEDLMRGKTVLVIAHRLSTLRSMDRLLIFNEGKIAEDGSHQQLLVLQGPYAKLWKIHLGEIS
ncbi:MAG: putative transporter ATP-binding protein [Parachlamydiales bacterium]|nr:putative transporter ATP-binding protein [Parachlamydiales bacterium]